jgi:hypothetical protein
MAATSWGPRCRGRGGVPEEQVLRHREACYALEGALRAEEREFLLKVARGASARLVRRP